MSEFIEMGKVSSRGQIAIPMDIRTEMGLEDGSKVLFLLADDILTVKKVSSQTWAQLTVPLRQVKKRIREDQVNDLIHNLRKK